MTGIDLGAMLRALRRAADLSQRQLAERAAVPQSTVGRIETGEFTNPRFRTVERLIEAAGRRITVSTAGSETTGAKDDQRPPGPALPTEIPHERLTDAAGRHYPAHLDIRATFPVLGRDWKLLRAGTPIYAFEVDRQARDDRRVERARAATVHIERTELSPNEAWTWTARTTTGALVAQLVAQIWPYTVTIPGELAEAVVCRLSAAPGWRRIGLEEQLLRGLRTEIADRDVSEVVAVAYSATEALYLRGFGFHSSARVISTLRINLEAISP